MKTRGNIKKCYYCGHNEICTKDHFYPKSKGGYLTVYACQICQRGKADMEPLIWLSYVLNHISFTKSTKKRISNTVLSLIEFMDKNQLK